MQRAFHLLLFREYLPLWKTWQTGSPSTPQCRPESALSARVPGVLARQRRLSALRTPGIGRLLTAGGPCTAVGPPSSPCPICSPRPGWFPCRSPAAAGTAGLGCCRGPGITSCPSWGSCCVLWQSLAFLSLPSFLPLPRSGSLWRIRDLGLAPALEGRDHRDLPANIH